MSQFTASEVVMTGQVGRRSSYEVKINDELVFSKLKLEGFPSHEDVIESIKAAMKGDSRLITEATKSSCTIL